MADLRTRIAAVIESIRIQRDGDAARMADAVIAELGIDEVLQDCRCQLRYPLND